MMRDKVLQEGHTRFLRQMRSAMDVVDTEAEAAANEVPDDADMFDTEVSSGGSSCMLVVVAWSGMSCAIVPLWFSRFPACLSIPTPCNLMPRRLFFLFQGADYLLWVQLNAITGRVPSQSIHFRMPSTLPAPDSVDAQTRYLKALAKVVRREFKISEASGLVVRIRDPTTADFVPLVRFVALHLVSWIGRGCV